MSIVKVQKIQIAAVASHKNTIIEVLQNFGSLHIEEITEQGGLGQLSPEEIAKIQQIELNHANAEYAIKILSPYGKKRGLLAGPITLTDQEMEEKSKGFDLNGLVKQCTVIEDSITSSKNDLNFLHNEKNLYTPWKNLKIDLCNLNGTKYTVLITGFIKTELFAATKEEIINLDRLTSISTVQTDDKLTYLTIICERTAEREIRQRLADRKFTETELPAGKGTIGEYLKSVSEKITTHSKNIKEQEAELTKLARQLDSLKIKYDHLNWQKEKSEAQRKAGNTTYSFIIEAWLPKNRVTELQSTLENHTKEFSIIEKPAEENELPPVILENKNVAWPFETLTRMYGLPSHTNLDPTPFLSVFFILFFALCLTDAAYGLIMFIVMGLALKFMTLGEGIRRLVKLLMYCGLVTFFVGAIFGGWFGFEAKYAPEFLTYTTAEGEKMFLFQQINAVTNPLAVLILALGLGFIQILFGLYIKLVHTYRQGYKKEALLDTAPWAFMMTGIGFFILGASQVLPAPAGMIGQWWVILATAILILTQGRDKKNPVMKLVGGILSLYGLVGYMSDILSYSRLLALGLATTIIALAVNVIVDLTGGIPYIGWLFAIIIFIGGHTFNLLINALGSFIHSGRLQFVEFFGKFFEGGGKEFRAFSKKNKYVYIKNN